MPAAKKPTLKGKPDLAVILAAAGMGTRLGKGPKLFQAIGGRPALVRVAETFLSHPAVGEVIAVVPTDYEGEARNVIADVANPRKIRILAVRGGATRQGSVGYGLEAITASFPFIAVHDVARVLISTELIERVLKAARESGAAIPALRVIDTVKEITPDGHHIVRTVPRDRLVGAQTPQIFSSDILRRAYKPIRDFNQEATDEAGLAEAIGVPVTVVEGDPANLKLTTVSDVVILNALLKAKGPGESH
jgi:2-C-methyl-D-erythritol 4-phosphate cytidylyltransferase